MKALFTRLSFAMLAIGAVACSKNRAVTSTDPNAPTYLVVDNQAFPDMTIYVLEGGRRIRLGLANGHSQVRFQIPTYLIRGLTTLRFQADPIGSNITPVSDDITVEPGDEVTLRIPPG